VNEMGGLISKNDQEGVWDECKKFGAEEMMKTVVKPKACFCCSLASCSHWTVIRDGPYTGTGMENAQAGTMITFGSMLLINDLSSIMKAHELCNALGIDEYAAGTTLAWAMEAYDRGIITKSDTNGIDLTWGNAKGMLEMIEKMGYREGFGDILSNGVKKASEIIGKGSEHFALHMKGLEMTAISPRAFWTMALSFAVNDSGADHTRVYPPYPPLPASVPKDLKLPFDIQQAAKRQIPDEKGKLVKWLFDTRAVLNCLETCVWNSRGRLFSDLRPFAKALSAATGFSFTDKDLLTIGERICNLERAYNVREGLSRKDDTLPDRYLKEVYPRGPSAGKVVPLEGMLDDYYEARGWDKKTGRPTQTKLIELGLSQVAEDLNAIPC